VPRYGLKPEHFKKGEGFYYFIYDSTTLWLGNLHLMQYMAVGYSIIYSIKYAVIYKFYQKQPNYKKSVRPQKGHCEKSCEIQGGGQEMS